MPSTGDPIVNIAELSNSPFSLYLAPVSGAAFAVLLYIIFIGGLLSGRNISHFTQLSALKLQLITPERSRELLQAAALPAAALSQFQRRRRTLGKTGKPVRCGNRNW